MTSFDPSSPDVWRMRVLDDLVSWAADCHREKVAWVFDSQPERQWTFTQIHRVVRHLAHWLAQRCPTPGDRVVLMVPNEAAFPLTWLACASAGLVTVPVNTRSRSADTAHVLTDARPALVVTTRELRGVVDEAAALAGIDVPVATVDELPLDPGDGRPPPLPRQPHRTVNIQYTSGTTGMPKGCMLSHRYWLEIARSLCENHPRVGPGDTLYTAQPFSYIDPQWNVVTAMLAGARLVVARRFSASGMWADLRRHDVTLFYCLGSMPAALLSQVPDPRDGEHRVRAVIASGIPTDLHAALEQRWGTPWYEAFGMTESGADLIVLPRDHDEVVGRACLGSPHRGREVLVADPQGRPVPDGAPGELLVRGVGMMDGYWGRPEATAAAFRDGWLRSGDEVVMDAAGRVFFRGRIKDMVRRSGENVSAAQVEAVVAAHPAVALAAVVPHPDPMVGEEVKVFVVLRGDSDEAVLPAVREHCARQLAPFKVPRYWAVRDELPMTPSERVSKAALRQDCGPHVDLGGGQS